MTNEKLQVNGALLVGPVIKIGSIETGEMMVDFPQNREAFVALSKRFRVRRHQDGWFVDGRGHRGQIWEFGIGKLGLTVVGRLFVPKCLNAGSWLHPKSVGNDEANFWCDWTDENLANLVSLARLQTRKRLSTVT